MNGLPQTNLEKKYRKICVLGQGSYGTVYLYQNRDTYKPNQFQTIFQERKSDAEQYVAVKIYKKPNTKSQGIDFSCLRQITCLQVFNHNNLMSCIQVMYNHKKQSNIPFQIAAVMNFHLQLKVLLDQSNYDDKKRIVKHIVKGLNHLHSNYYFHRDLKPDNVFVSQEGYVKLADFGFTKQFGTPYKKYTFNACTIEYRAPQVFMGTHYYTQKSDIWSIGCIIAYIFGGKPMFQIDGPVADIDILSQIFYLFGTPTKENWPGFDRFPIKYQFKAQKSKNVATELNLNPQVGAFIQYVMQLEPARRPSAQQMLQHSFLKPVSDAPFNVQAIYEEKIDKLVNQYAHK